VYHRGDATVHVARFTEQIRGVEVETGSHREHQMSTRRQRLRETPRTTPSPQVEVRGLASTVTELTVNVEVLVLVISIAPPS